MNAVKQALFGKVTQVPPHRVLGDSEGRHELRGDDPAVVLQPVEDHLLALSRQHRCAL